MRKIAQNDKYPIDHTYMIISVVGFVGSGLSGIVVEFVSVLLFMGCASMILVAVKATNKIKKLAIFD